MSSRTRPFTSVHLISLLVFVAIVGMLNACVGTRAAYESAETLEAKAYVVTEHYAALVKEAADLREAGTLTGDALARVQAADNQARPLVLQLRTSVQAYTALKNADTAAALQAALDSAVVQVSALINAIRNR